MLPIALSIAGSMLPMIVDAFRTGKSPEEAAKDLAPRRQEMIDRLIGGGLSQQAAQTMADETMAGELEKAQLPEPMSPWVTTLLGIGGMFGGLKAGKMIDARRAAKTSGVAPTTKVPAKNPPATEPKASTASETAASRVGDQDDVYNAGFRSPAVDKAMAGSLDSVTPSSPLQSGAHIGYEAQGPFPGLPEPSRRMGYTPQMGAPQAASVIPAGFDPRMAVDAEWRINAPFPGKRSPVVPNQMVDDVIKDDQMRAMQELRRRQFAGQGKPDYRTREVGMPLTGDVAL